MKTLIIQDSNKLYFTSDLHLNHENIIRHYPMLSWYQSHAGAWQLFGHWHSNKLQAISGLEEEIKNFIIEENIQKTKLSLRQYDVGVDNNNFNPISYNQLKNIIKNQQNET